MYFSKESLTCIGAMFYSQFMYGHFLAYVDYIALNVKVTVNDELAHMYVNKTKN
jgi:hypothetical protein